MEVMIVHGGSPKRIRKLNEAISAMQVPIEIDGKKGHSPVYPYRCEIWMYKMKKEAVNEFLSFIRGNTIEVAQQVRPGQGLMNLASWVLATLANIRNAWVNFREQYIRRKGKPRTQSTMSVPDMKKITPGSKVIDGWSYAWPVVSFPDHIGPDGDEQL